MLTHNIIGEGELISDGDDDTGGDVGGDDVYNRRAEPVLVSFSNSYSVNKILVGGSRPSSCPAYTVY